MLHRIFQVTDNETGEVANYDGRPAYFKDQKAAKGARNRLNGDHGTHDRFRVSRGPDHPKRKQ